MSRVARLLLLLLPLLLACDGSPTEPTDTRSRGRLGGTVTIGPNCPNDDPARPCPTPSGEYARRKVLVYDEPRRNLLFTVDLDSAGVYFIDLLPGRYTVDLKPAGADTTTDVPKSVEVLPLQLTRVDIRVDTGIR